MLFPNKSHTPVVSAKLPEPGALLTHALECALSETTTGGLGSLHGGSRAVINPVPCDTATVKQVSCLTSIHMNFWKVTIALAWPPQSPHAAREAILAANTELRPLAGKHRNPKHQTSWLDKTRIMWSYNKLKPQKQTGKFNLQYHEPKVLAFFLSKF